MPLCPPSKRKPAPDAKYQPGDILLFRRSGYQNSKMYKIVFILETWKVKKEHYRYLEIMCWPDQKRRTRSDIEETTEYKMKTMWGRDWEELGMDDLGFLALFGSPAALIEGIIEKGAFKRKNEKSLQQAKERVRMLEERVQSLEIARGLLEERYADIDTESS